METGRIKRRKRRRWLGYVAFLAVVLSSAAVLCLAMFFRTQEIVVVGNQRYTAEELISASGIQLEQNIFAVDRARTAAQIKGVFSYLEEVEVVPVLPTTMEIRVVESVPAVAVVNSPESYSLVSTGGRIIEQCAGMSEDDLPLVLGTNFAWYEQGAYPLELPEEVTDESRKDHREATDQELEGVRVMKTLGYVLESIETVGLDKVTISISATAFPPRFSGTSGPSSSWAPSWSSPGSWSLPKPSWSRSWRRTSPALWTFR